MKVAPSNTHLVHLAPHPSYTDGLAAHFNGHPHCRMTRAMLAAARLVGDHSAVSPRDAVQQAWVKALSNPETIRPANDDFERFVKLMRKLAKYEAKTNRQFSSRQQQREVATDTDIAEHVAGRYFLDALEARLILERPYTALEPNEQKLLHALYYDETTIDELRLEQQHAWTTVGYRKKRLSDRLYAAIQALAVTLPLVPRKAHAFVAHAKQQASHVLAHATHIGGTLAVSATCDMLVPTGLSFMSETTAILGLTQGESTQTNTEKTVGLQPLFVPEVAPEEPTGLDAETNECLAGDMKCTKLTHFPRNSRSVGVGPDPSSHAGGVRGYGTTNPTSSRRTCRGAG